MLTLFHHNMSCNSRAIRLILFEYEIPSTLVEEQEWARRAEFLRYNPACTIPVLLTENGDPIVESYAIIEYLDETVGRQKKDKWLFPANPIARAEVRRLLSWFLQKFKDEVTRPIVRQRIYKREMPTSIGGGAPDSTILRHARSNIRPHMEYLNWLAKDNNCLTGDNLTYADFAAAGGVSVLDYLGEIDWNTYPYAKEWYTRIKSRPSMRPLLFDRIRGIAPSSSYTD